LLTGTMAFKYPSPFGCERMSRIADRVICVAMPESFFAIGPWYEDFTQTTEV
jgi:predicted phosphoribosyltransferase